MDYKEAYEKEHLKNAELAGALADLEVKNADLEYQLNRIKNNPLWKMTKPARSVYHFVMRQKKRLETCGGVKDVFVKLGRKARQRKAMKKYGTSSFPTVEMRKQQEEATFERMPKVSILVPLYNTPTSYLTEMIDSVVNQTYKNWELCLADGSDDAHAYVRDMCRDYIAKDHRIVYNTSHSAVTHIEAYLNGSTKLGQVNVASGATGVFEIDPSMLDRSEGALNVIYLRALRPDGSVRSISSVYIRVSDTNNPTKDECVVEFGGMKFVVAKGSVITVPDYPYDREGFVQCGWTDDDVSKTLYKPGDTITVNKSMSFYIRFKPTDMCSQFRIDEVIPR